MKYSFLFLFFFINLSCRTSPSDIKAIYGEDDRIELFEFFDSKEKTFWKSTALIVNSNEIIKTGQQNVSLVTQNFGEKYNLCSDQPHLEQRVAGRCTGFLISDNHLVTAGHCIKNDAECQNTYFVFDFSVENDYQNDLSLVATKNLRRCSRVVVSEYDPELHRDYAVVELDTPISERIPFELSYIKAPPVDRELIAVGNPLGLPTKVSLNGIAREEATVRSCKLGQKCPSTIVSDKYFSLDIEAFGGSSGSPVIDKTTEKVVGILVRGGADFVTTKHEETECRKLVVCSGDCGGEDVIFLNPIKEILEK